MRTFNTRKFKRKNKVTVVLALLLVLIVGYAIMSTQLKVDGTLNISKMEWDVHFENVQVTSGSVTATTAPTSNNIDTKEMEYAVNLTKPGDYYEFTADIVNKGTMSAKIIELDNKLYDSNNTAISNPKYLNTSLTYLDENGRYSDFKYYNEYNEVIQPNSSLSIKIRVEFEKYWINVSDLPSDGDKDFTFKLKIDYEQANTIYARSTCPGKYCVYASPYPVSLSPYSPEYPNQNILTNYTKDYRTLNKNAFGGFVIDDSNRIIKTYICGIHDNGKVYCIGSNYGEEEIEYLNGSDLWNNTCNVSANYNTNHELQNISASCNGSNTRVETDGMSSSTIYDNVNGDNCNIYWSTVLCN